MASTEEILKAARSLGQMVASHAAAAKFEQAARKLQGDTEAQRVLNDYNRFLQKLAEKEQQGQPIEVAEKHEMEKLQAGVVRNATLRDFQLAQMDYMDLMRRVEEAMYGGPEGGAGAGQGGGAVAASPIINPDALGNVKA